LKLYAEICYSLVIILWQHAYGLMYKRFGEGGGKCLEGVNMTLAMSPVSQNVCLCFHITAAVLGLESTDNGSI
jgi:hypothetical protein